MVKTIIEISSAAGIHYQKFDTPFIRVGRGYQNDLIIADSHVSAEHLVISTGDEGWIVEDLGSENGVFVKKHSKVLKQARLESGDEIRIGKTRLRIVSPSHPVGQTKPLVRKNIFLKKISHPFSAWAVVLLMIALYALEEYLMTPRNLSIWKLTSGAVVIVLLVMIWGGVWAFVGRLTKQKARFFAQLSLGALFFILLIPLGNFSTHLGYFASSRVVEGVSSAILSAVLCTVFLVGNLAIATNISLRKRIWVASSVSLVIISIAMLLYFTAKDEFNPNPNFYAVLKPPLIKISYSKSINKFFEEGAMVFDIQDKKK